MRELKILLLSILLNLFIFLSVSVGEIIKQITITGNVRISDETILMFSNIDVGQDLKTSKINDVLKNLYDTNFFNNVSVDFENNIFLINIDEAPLIENIEITGIKAKKIESLLGVI